MPRFVLTLLLVVISASLCSASSGVFAEAISYTKPLSANKIFVMLGDPASEEKATAKRPKEAAEIQELRKKYPKSGVYLVTTGEAVWQLPDDTFSPFDGTFLSVDARHLIRVEGQWWRTKDFPGGKRPSQEAQDEQLSATAISFFADGKLLKSYLLKDVLSDPAKVMHSPQHLLWYASGSLNEQTGRFLLFTQDSNRIIFNYQTGEVTNRVAVGLGNPLFTSILVVCGVLSALMLLTWVYFVFIRGVKPVAQA
jgi:hypothetical protein